MPPKLKLNKSKGKAEIKLDKTPPAPTPTGTSNSTAAPQNGMTAEIQEQFEIELYWCIQQLQRTLASGKLNQKQVQDNTKTLNTLMSNSTPFIKKRQVMRVTFGDYRTKMNEESKKFTKGINLKISSSPNQKSKFLKKAGPLDEQSKMSTESEILSSNVAKVEISNDTPSSSTSFRFVNSSNDFRFSFNVDES